MVLLIRFSPAWLTGRLRLADLVNRAAARDSLCAAVSSFGVTAGEGASGVTAGLGPTDSISATLPRRDEPALR